MSVIFLESLNLNLKFGKIRETASGNKLIDILNTEIYQSTWVEVIRIKENGIIVYNENFYRILKQIDEKIINYLSDSLNFTIQEITSMYSSLYNKYLLFPIGTNTVLFDESKNYYFSKDVLKKINVGDYVRLIINFKKIQFKDHEFKIIFETIQIES